MVNTINKESPEKVKMRQSGMLPVMEEFHTIQGEGYHSGRAAYFVRLGGCDVGCHWCDVKESWPLEGHELTSINDLLSRASESSSKFVVITGGEPLMYDLTNLTNSFKKNGFELAIETSGAYPLSGEWHWICLSPKKFKAPVGDIHQKANELKVVIFNKSDFKWAEEHAKLVNEDCQLFLQPEWDKRNEMMPLIVEYVKENPKWKISLQNHKYLGIP